jgi:hypothetical protein
MGIVVLQFRYRDDWYKSTDGEGYSLTLADLKTDPDDFSKKESWRSSDYVDGTPGLIP